MGSRADVHEEATGDGAALGTVAGDDTLGAGRDAGDLDRPLESGDAIGGAYRIVRVIGAGAMGVVYEAIDLVLDRRVAVKVCTRRHDAASAARAWREAKAMARLSHPNVVTVFEVDRHQDWIYIAMELVEGSTARAWVAAAPRSWREIVDVYVQAARGLQAAHRLGIVHRDFKPDNVLVGADARVRVADFGVASMREPDVDSATIDTQADVALVSGQLAIDGPVETRTGAMLGTPAYMAPEQLLATRVDARADQFSLCVALYEALFGTRPFAGETLAARFVAIDEGEVAAPAGAGRVPAHVLAAIRRGLHRDPDRRFADLDALVGALRADPARVRRRALAVVGVVAALGLAAWLGSGSEQPRCESAATASERLWNPARGEALHESFARTASTRAAIAAAQAEAALGGWAEGWAVEREQACLATWRGEQSAARLDARMDCLERARLDAEAVMQALLAAEAETVAESDTLIERLPESARCREPAAIVAGDRVESDDRTHYDALYAAVAQADTDERAGRLTDVDVRLERALAEIDGARWPWLAARAHAAFASLLDGRSDYAGAVAQSTEALRHAHATEDPALQLRVMMELAEHLGRRGVDIDEALRWLIVAEVVGGRIDEPPWLRSKLAVTRVSLLLFADRFAEAEASARAELARTEDVGGRAVLLTRLALAQGYAGRNADALATHLEASALAREIWSPPHPHLYMVVANTAQSLSLNGRHAEALVLADEALEMARGLYGPDSVEAGNAQQKRASVLTELGRYREAIAGYELALAAARAHGNELSELHSLSAMANARVELGESAVAVELGGAAVRISDRLHGPGSADSTALRANLGGLLLASDRAADAIVPLREAIANGEPALGPEHPYISLAMANLALALLGTDRPAEALELLDRVAAIEARRLPPEDARHGQFSGARATMLYRLGRFDEAIAAHEQAIAQLDRAFADGHPKLVEALLRQGVELVEMGRPEQAIAPLERALAMMGDVEVEPIVPPALRFALARALWSRPAARARARELADAALATFRELDEPARVTATETWRAAHR